MKKILLVTRPICPPWDEASKNFAYYLAKNVEGFEFHLLTCGFLPDLPSNVHQNPIYTSGKLTYLQRLRLLKLRKMRINFDIIHYMLTPSILNSFSFKAFVNHKKIKTIQTIATLREDILSDKSLKKIIFADLVITYSDYAKNKLEQLGFGNIKRIYPGIDLNLYSPAPKDPELMKNLGLNKEDFIIVFPGEFTRLGGTDKLMGMILQYTSMLKEKNIKFIFACRVKNEKDRKKKEEISKMLKEKDLENYVKLPDTFNSLEKVFNLSDIVIYPVLNMRGKFDVPLAVVEAMACGKPVIISDISILREFANSQNSVTIEAGNTEQLAKAIEGLYLDKNQRETIGENARKFAQENFDIKKIADMYKEVYESL